MMTGLEVTEPAESANHSARLPQLQHQIDEATYAYPEVHDPELPEVHDPVLPEVYHPPVVFEGPAFGVVDGKGPDPSRICGFSRKTALIVLATLFLVTVAVAVGTAASIVAARNKSMENIPTPANSPTGSTSSKVVIETIPGPTDSSTTSSSSNIGVETMTVESVGPANAPSPMRAIATTQDDVNIFNFWQANTGDIWMHAYYFPIKAWVDPIRLSLTYPATLNTSLGVLAWKYADYLEIRVNYAAVGQSGIAELRYRCYENGTSCTNMNATNIIVKAIPAPAPGAGYTLIAPELNNLRAYSVSRDGLVQEAVYTPALDQWTSPVPISNGARAHVASPLGATIIQDDIWLFWFSETKQLQFATSQYTGTAWSEVQNIPAPVPTELPRSVGVTRSDDPDTTQIFFFDDTTMQMSQYSNNQWSRRSLGPSVLKSSISNGPLGAVGWSSSNVRLYYVVNGSIYEYASKTPLKKWTVGELGADKYYF